MILDPFPMAMVPIHMAFLWFSYSFPEIFLWSSYGVPMAFLWHPSQKFGFLFLWLRSIFLWSSYGLTIVPIAPQQESSCGSCSHGYGPYSYGFLLFSFGFPMVSYGPYGIPAKK